MNEKNLIKCVLRKNPLICCNVWNFFSNVKQSLNKVRLNSCRTDVVFYCNRLSIELIVNFDTILTYKRSFFRKRYAPFVFHLEFFLKCKIARKRSKAEFMQKLYFVYCNRRLKNKKICVATKFPI